MSFLDRLPNHVALTLDGNRRWAERKGYSRKLGIRFGIKKTKEVMYDWTRRFEAEYGVKPFNELTIHALTLNNMRLRSKEELDEIQDAFTETFREVIRDKSYANVRVKFGGRIEMLKPELQKEIRILESETIDFDKYKFNVAIAYDGNDEIRMIAEKACARSLALAIVQPERHVITNFNLQQFADFPDASPIDLWIRTSGEKRLSGFMLFYIGYAEIFFLDCLAEDFKYEEFVNVLKEYSMRDRRFGK